MKHLIKFLYWLSETSEKWATVLWLRECRKSGISTPHTMLRNYFQSNAEKIAASVLKNNSLLKLLRNTDEHEIIDDLGRCYNPYEK